jgi:hypothetical protein
MKRDVTELSLMFEEMEKNVRFTMDRRSKHNILTEGMIGSIKLITLLKVMFIIVISGVQVYLIQKFYGKSRRINPFYETGL